MAGLYIHIPFCKQACHYCNFHFSTTLKHQQDIVHAICKELKLRASELSQTPLESIYFGGGTPSLLSDDNLKLIFNTINDHYTISSVAEITLEANPDDLDDAKIEMLSKTNINRLSIGVQSFFEEDLKEMNRAHSAQEAKSSIVKSKDYFDNITIDLMYGIPQMTESRWLENLHMAFDLGIKHLSCYTLTVEPKTALEHFINSGKHLPIDDALALSHFNILLQETAKLDYVHYEFCSFGKPGYFSKHNTSYWLGKPYLGVGPSAHSFDGQNRSWNVSNNISYIKSLAENTLPKTTELLTLENRFNEYIMTGLRTMWGVSLQKIENDFGVDFRLNLERNAKKYLLNKTLVIEKEILKVTPKGQFLSDGIAADLFVV